MIKNSRALSLAETKDILIKEETEKAKDVVNFIKKFTKLNITKAREIRKELEDLNFFGLKQEELVKIIDLMPEDTEDLRKILASSDLSLKQDEMQKILEIIKKYKTK